MYRITYSPSNKEFGSERKTQEMTIAVSELGWGEARPSDIRVLLENTALHLNQYLISPFSGEIILIPSPPGDPVPRTHLRHNHSGPITIQLTARDTYWAQFAFHSPTSSVTSYPATSGCGAVRTAGSTRRCANWRRSSRFDGMAETWPVNPPFREWRDYAHSLADYAAERITRKESQLPEGETLISWLNAREDELRDDPYQRQLNAVVAYSLLPLFEASPTSWNVVPYLPASASRLHSYLREWPRALHPRIGDSRTRYWTPFQNDPALAGTGLIPDS